MSASNNTVQSVLPTDRSTTYIRLVNLLAVILPFLGLGAAVWLLWGHGIGWIQVGLLVGMHLLSGFGITVGYHRLFTHRAFVARRPVAALLGVMGSMAVEGPIVRWAAQHRRHHQLSDHEGDPHSPHLHGKGLINTIKGLWHAHIGWTFERDIGGLDRYIPDLLADRMVVVISKLFPLWVIIGGLIPATLGGLLTGTWMGALQGFLWGGLVRVFLLQHVTFSINSICHIWGTQPFRSHDQSRNNPLFGILGMGEGWHNNHHAFPASARHGLRWWEIDASYWLIRCMGWVRLAWDIRTPSPELMAAKRA